MEINNLVNEIKRHKHVDYIIVTNDIVNIIYDSRHYVNSFDTILDKINIYLASKDIVTDITNSIMAIHNYYSTIPYFKGYNIINKRISETIPSILYSNGNYYIKMESYPLLVFYMLDYCMFDNHNKTSFRNERLLTKDLSDMEFKLFIEICFINNFNYATIFNYLNNISFNIVYGLDILLANLTNKYKNKIFNGWIGDSLDAMICD